MAEIFDINHETGDLTQYGSTVGSEDLDVNNAAALCGSFGLEVTINDTGVHYGQKNFTQITSADYRYRIRIDPNGLTISNYYEFDVAALRDGSNRATLTLYRAPGVYRMRARVLNDSFGSEDTAYYTITDAVHYAELHVEYASSAVANDGIATFWIDGVQQEQMAGLDIYDMTKPSNARLGACGGVDAGTSGIFYLDDFIFRDDANLIGPCGAPTTSTSSSTTSTSTTTTSLSTTSTSQSTTTSVSTSTSLTTTSSSLSTTSTSTSSTSISTTSSSLSTSSSTSISTSFSTSTTSSSTTLRLQFWRRHTSPLRTRLKEMD